jgi:hypothetical protein
LGEEYKGRNDRQRVIDWLRQDLSYYRQNVGEITEFNTVITQELIDKVESRVEQLEKREDAIKRRLSKFT